MGTHRVAVAEVVARLLSIGNLAVDDAVAELQLVPRLVRLCLDRPHCSPLQVMCLRIIRCERHGFRCCEHCGNGLAREGGRWCRRMPQANP